MENFDLVIFDCDGTLVDSEYLHNVIVADLLGSHGMTQFTLDYNLEHFAGKGMDAVLVQIAETAGRPAPPQFMEEYVAEFGRRVRTELKLIDGVLEILTGLDPALKTCIASNGEVGNVRAQIEAVGLDRFFSPERVFTKAQVVNPKPAPDLFLFAARQMGAEPARTLVIEDSLTGAKAGLAAGMTVAGITAVHHEPAAQETALRALGVHHILRRFADIEPLLTNGAPAKRA